MAKTTNKEIFSIALVFTTFCAALVFIIGPICADWLDKRIIGSARKEFQAAFATAKSYATLRPNLSEELVMSSIIFESPVLYVCVSKECRADNAVFKTSMPKGIAIKNGDKDFTSMTFNSQAVTTDPVTYTIIRGKKQETIQLR